MIYTDTKLLDVNDSDHQTVAGDPSTEIHTTTVIATIDADCQSETKALLAGTSEEPLSPAGYAAPSNTDDATGIILAPAPDAIVEVGGPQSESLTVSPACLCHASGHRPRNLYVLSARGWTSLRPLAPSPRSYCPPPKRRISRPRSSGRGNCTNNVRRRLLRCFTSCARHCTHRAQKEKGFAVGLKKTASRRPRLTGGSTTTHIVKVCRCPTSRRRKYRSRRVPQSP